MTKVLKVKCPHCKEEFNYYSSKSRPFCSSRCKEIDLGHWLTESYTVPSSTPLSDSDLDKVIKERNEKLQQEIKNDLGDNFNASFMLGVDDESEY